MFVQLLEGIVSQQDHGVICPLASQESETVPLSY